MPLVNEPLLYTALQEEHPHPSDGIIHFDSASHVYFLPHTRLPSIISTTTLWKDVFPPFPAYVAVRVRDSIHTRFSFWYENRFTCSPKSTHPRFYNKSIWPDKYDVFISPDVFVYLRNTPNPSPEWIKAHQPLPPPFGTFTTADVSEAWSRDGTALHLQIERYLNRDATLTLHPSPEWGYFLAFLKKHEVEWEVYRTEMRIYHPGLDLAGSIDCVLRNKIDGTFALVDWKRSGKLKATEELDVKQEKQEFMLAPFESFIASERIKYYLQLNTYGMTCRTQYEMIITWMVNVCLHPSNTTFLEIRVPDASRLKRSHPFRVGLTEMLESRKQHVAKRRRTYEYPIRWMMFLVMGQDTSSRVCLRGPLRKLSLSTLSSIHAYIRTPQT